MYYAGDTWSFITVMFMLVAKTFCTR